MTTDLPASAGRWTLIATILASAMAFIDSSALSIVQPALQSDFGVNYNLIAWVINGYNLMLAALILVGGSLGDLYGRRRIFTTGIIVFAVASLACGFAPSIELLIAGRVAQGIGGALMIPGSLAIITAVFPPAERGPAIGTWSAVGALTVLVGPVLGGVFASLGFWRGVFFINLPLAALALYGLRYVPETRDSQARQLDIPGALLAIAGLAGLTYGFTEAPVQGWNQPLILVMLLGGALALILFIVVEARSHMPMVPLRLFRSPAFSGTNLLTFFLYGGLALIPTFLPLNLIRIQNYPPEIAGPALLPLGISLFILSRFAGGMVNRVGARALLTVGPAVAGLGMFWFGVPGLTAGPGEYWTTYFIGALLLGIGMGITVAPLTTTVMNSAPADVSGTASGINNAVSRIAGVLAIAVFTAAALTAFSDNLQARAAGLELTESVRTELRVQAAKLAEAAVPAGLADDVQPLVSEAIKLGFIDTFRLVAWGAAGLAWLGAACAWVMVRR
jgi:EmrB/QacA subfamily drug resistance transporter